MASKEIVFVFTAGISTLQILQRPTKGKVSVDINMLTMIVLTILELILEGLIVYI